MNSLAALLALALALYSVGAPVCDLSCSFMQLQQCRTALDTAATDSSAPAESDMNMPGMDADSVAMIMPASTGESAWADQGASHHPRNQPAKSPTACIHASCLQASASQRLSIPHFSLVVALHSPFAAKDPTLDASFSCVDAAASPPAVLLGNQISPLRI
jgi:hypothetical protein